MRKKERERERVDGNCTGEQNPYVSCGTVEGKFLVLLISENHYSVLQKLLLAEPLEAGISFAIPDIWRPRGNVGHRGKRPPYGPLILLPYHALILFANSIFSLISESLFIRPSFQISVDMHDF